MTLTYQLFTVADGFGYHVTSDDGISLNVRQEYAPGVPGNVVMSEAEAHAHAQALITEREALTGVPDAVDVPDVA